MTAHQGKKKSGGFLRIATDQGTVSSTGKPVAGTNKDKGSSTRSLEEETKNTTRQHARTRPSLHSELQSQSSRSICLVHLRRLLGVSGAARQSCRSSASPLLWLCATPHSPSVLCMSLPARTESVPVTFSLLRCSNSPARARFTPDACTSVNTKLMRRKEKEISSSLGVEQVAVARTNSLEQPSHFSAVQCRVPEEQPNLALWTGGRTSHMDRRHVSSTTAQCLLTSSVHATTCVSQSRFSVS